ncbi:MAG TPA: YceI family protein [Patescibacteria group bacterium]|nr:YceI family protein [Patescibacteria group bacterium]
MKKGFKKPLVAVASAFLFAASFASALAPTTWNLDSSHSNVNFTVDYLVVSEVDGRFGKVEGAIQGTKDDFSDATATITIDVNSINTDNEKRDGHLKSADFFDVANHPNITFKANNFKKVKGNQYKITGDLTMRGVTKKITMDAQHLGNKKDGYGNMRSFWKANFAVNRQDYGVSWKNTTQAGEAVVGDEVRMKINAQFVMAK